MISLLIYSNRARRRRLFPLPFDTKDKQSKTKIIPLKQGPYTESGEMAK